MGAVWESPTDVAQASAQGNLARAQAKADTRIAGSGDGKGRSPAAGVWETGLG